MFTSLPIKWLSPISQCAQLVCHPDTLWWTWAMIHTRKGNILSNCKLTSWIKLYFRKQAKIRWSSRELNCQNEANGDPPQVFGSDCLGPTMENFGSRFKNLLWRLWRTLDGPSKLFVFRQSPLFEKFSLGFYPVILNFVMIICFFLNF